MSCDDAMSLDSLVLAPPIRWAEKQVCACLLCMLCVRMCMHVCVVCVRLHVKLAVPSPGSSSVPPSPCRGQEVTWGRSGCLGRTGHSAPSRSRSVLGAK